MKETADVVEEEEEEKSSGGQWRVCPRLGWVYLAHVIYTRLSLAVLVSFLHDLVLQPSIKSFISQ